MKRIYSFLFVTLVALFVALVFHSCAQKEEVMQDGPYRFEFKAVKEVIETRVLTESTVSGKSRLDATFKKGEIVYMYAYEYKMYDQSRPDETTIKEIGVLTAQEDGVKTTFAGDVDEDFVVSYPDISGPLRDYRLRLIFSYKHKLVFDYEGQDGTLETIDNNYDFAIGNIPYEDGVAVVNGEWASNELVVDHQNKLVTIPTTIVFSSPQSIVKFILFYKDTNAPISPDKLTIDIVDSNNGGEKIVNYFNPLLYFDYPDGHPNKIRRGALVVDRSKLEPSKKTNEVYVSLPGRHADFMDIGPYISNFYTDKIILTAEVGSDTYSYELGGTVPDYSDDDIWFASNHYYIVTVYMSKAQSPVTDPDVELDADSGFRYGQGTVGSLE